MQIVFHADDFGATDNVNNNILAAWQAGGLDSVSVLANGDALDSAAAALASNADKPLRLIVHLNLSEGPSLASPAEVPLLVNDEGRLSNGFIGLWKIWLSSNETTRQQLLKQVETEWRLQIKTVIDSFKPRNVHGVDGHIHVHMLPFLFPIAAKLTHEAGLSDIRISRELIHLSPTDSVNVGFGVNIIKHMLLKSLSHSAIRTANQYDLRHPNRIAGVLYSGNMTPKVIASVIRSANRSNIDWLEVLFHPGRALPDEIKRWENNEGVGKFYLDARRDMERDMLVKHGNRRR